MHEVLRLRRRGAGVGIVIDEDDDAEVGGGGGQLSKDRNMDSVLASVPVWIFTVDDFSAEVFLASASASPLIEAEAWFEGKTTVFDTAGWA